MNIISAATVAMLLSCSFQLALAQTTTFFVAADGSDIWSGRLASPNQGKSDGPFATLIRARNAVREIKASGELKSPVTVQVRGGNYYLHETLILANQDSGTKDYQVTYTAYPGEKPILSGGRKVTGWKPYKGKILQADVPESKGGKLKTRQLFLNGERQIRSRYPNIDPRNPLYGNWLFPEKQEEENEKRVIKYLPGTFPRHWTKPSEGEVNIYPYGWLNNVIPIRSMDDKNCTITLDHEITQLDRSPWWFTDILCINPNCRFIVENILEELDQPGEWCLDSEEGKLYFWPPSGALKASDETVIPVSDCLIDMHGASWINISGFTFTETTGGDDYHRAGGEGYGAVFLQPGVKYVGEALHMRDTSNCCIENNRFHGVGGNAIYLEFQNARNTIRRNEIAYAGASGIVLLGSRDKLPVFNRVVDNQIHHCGKINKYAAGVLTTICEGNLIAHNYIHDMPHHAINLGSNGHGRNIIEYNDIRNVCLELHDTGAINSWGDVPGPKIEREWERSGHIIRYNLIMDPLGCTVRDRELIVPDRDGTGGIYLDDCTSNCVIFGNIIVRAGKGIDFHNGRHNLVENNILVDCTFATQYHDDQSNRFGTSNMQGFLKSNWFCRNIVYYTQQNQFMSRIWNAWTDEVIAESDHNLVFFPKDAPFINKDHGKEKLLFVEWQKLGYDEHSVIADPMFVDPAQDNYQLRPESPAFKLGFQPIDMSQIGIRPKDGK